MDTAQYIATMEAAYRAKELKLFSNIAETSYPTAGVPGGYPPDATTVPNDSLSRLNGNGPKVGPALVLKVMAGDQIDIAVKSFYRSQGVSAGNADMVSDVISSLASGIVGISGDVKGTLSQLNNSLTSPLAGVFNNFKTANNPEPPAGKPKAYLNWILLDERFNYVSSYPQSGALPVGMADQINALANTGIPVTKSGYLYIYVSNETKGWDVFFDNLSVKHYTGAMLEETHYYPFGLTMVGISSKALKTNYYENRKKYNGIEYNGDLDVDTYDAFYRNLDPQIGRWWQIDPKIENGMENISPYASMYDDPILKSDPLGDEPDGCCSFSDLVDGAKQLVRTTTMVAVGVANAWTSNQMLGEGRVDVDKQAGLTDGDKLAAKVGQAIGDGLSIVTGAGEISAAATGELASVGIATPIAVPAALHGASSVTMGVVNLMKGVNNPGKNDGSSGSKANTSSGRGSNNRKPDKNAQGDHSVIDKNGNTTYKKNNKNPSGFDEVKRTDVKGKAHTNTDGTTVHTPHVHTKGQKNVRPAVKGQDY